MQTKRSSPAQPRSAQLLLESIHALLPRLSAREFQALLSAALDLIRDYERAARSRKRPPQRGKASDAKARASRRRASLVFTAIDRIAQRYTRGGNWLEDSWVIEQLRQLEPASIKGMRRPALERTVGEWRRARKVPVLVTRIVKVRTEDDRKP
jgi:hypothetical protein